ncbi:hypothetical protein D3C83_20950 [compost metagenome]
MLACDRLQYSAHCPRYVPGLSASKVTLFSRPGTTSCLPASLGTQKLWMTPVGKSVSLWDRKSSRDRIPGSMDRSVRRTGRPVGMWSSLAVPMR